MRVTGAPEGYDAYLAAEAAHAAQRARRCSSRPTISRRNAAPRRVRFFAPDLAVLPFPAWDCLPYDRVSPKPDIESARLATLAALARRKKDSRPAIVVTTVNAIAAARAAARLPSRVRVSSRASASKVEHDKLVAFLGATAMRAPAPCASRAISRCAAASSICGRRAREEPLRLDFFGTTLDAIRRFDAETQLSTDQIDARSNCCPRAKRRSITESISRFRAGYVAAFGPASDDPLYESVSAGRKHPGHGALAAAVPRTSRHVVRLHARRAGVPVASGGGSRRPRGWN